MTIERLTLQQAADVLEWAAGWQRATMQREMNAADPIPGVAELRRLAKKLRDASELREEGLRAALSGLSEEELAILRLWEDGATGPSLHPDAAERDTRRRYAASLRSLRELVEAVRSRM